MAAKPRPRSCIDCGRTVACWDLDEAAICDECLERRDTEAEQAKDRFEEMRAEMGAKAVARTKE